jgi:hypothetical protein
MDPLTKYFKDINLNAKDAKTTKDAKIMCEHNSCMKDSIAYTKCCIARVCKDHAIMHRQCVLCDNKEKIACDICYQKTSDMCLGCGMTICKECIKLSKSVGQNSLDIKRRYCRCSKGKK